MIEPEKSITLSNKSGDEAIVVDCPEEIVAWAARGYFSAEGREVINASKRRSQEADTAIHPVVNSTIGDMSVEVGEASNAEVETDVVIKPAKKRKAV